MERQIGERFRLNGKTFEVVENNSKQCEGCIFYGFLLCRFPVIADKTGACGADERDDKKEVIFKAITDEGYLP